ncbi:hypothetical protein PF005_g26126 [Phytophthora fragariae]|uniref:Uncharacterized protein n=2 Tax=Phytophthora TaxID=4783 RepID=A0A6A3VUR7_9STRA|nr:hypothetical protein PF003_g2909 [Phytophthora fragariae]KAE8972064.1 hypothetical protein PR002_g26626 [Phytophthora rubi]KAE8922830.1 hypothetical protein PF009_g26908 [Phytophthora fragariae]KAE8972589.1 hypothetical protein PR001_g26563 [Phytophthora rubi]KAE8974107.1 hypothetical protein PF011_g24990 [Phytophthora fragariae]
MPDDEDEEYEYAFEEDARCTEVEHEVANEVNAEAGYGPPP